MEEQKQSWKLEFHWDCPAGKALNKLIEYLPKQSRFEITVFGSAPLQLTIDQHLASNDVDIFSESDLTEIIKKAHLAKGQAVVYIEQIPPETFVASSDWRTRSYNEQRQNVKLVFPHPIDILVAKLKRCEEKDMMAFETVYEKTGHPTEEELKIALRKVVDIYRPAFDEEGFVPDAATNTKRIWKNLYKKDINVREEIIKPALARRREIYSQQTTFKSELEQMNSSEEIDSEETGLKL